MERIYYESDAYENDGEPGVFAGITITADEDGPRFKFSCDSGQPGSEPEMLMDLPIPACEALAIAFALERAAKQTIIAAERPVQPHQHASAHAGPQLDPGMTPYGRREVPAAESVSLPPCPDHTQALPVRPARAIHPGQQPSRRTA